MVNLKSPLTDEQCWQAVIERDTHFDGTFYYAVKTTGIYCRPGCSSRLPKRCNVEFFSSKEEAEHAGYRPCRRCRPDGESRKVKLGHRIIEACRTIEKSETTIPLKDLASSAQMSPHHFHRMFRKIVGITPKQYSATMQARRFKEDLRNGGSVTEAIYSAGFSSASGAYNKQQDQLAMQPKTYRKGAIGEIITYGTARCFLGWMIVAATEKGICAIEFGDEPDELPAMVHKRFPKAILQQAGPGFRALIEEVIDYISSPDTEFELPLDIRGTAFQQQVWQILRQIKPGETVSYTEVAERLGRPEAVRAVAGAIAANKIGAVIPCHRVISKVGKISGYRWGIERKKQLIDTEKTNNRNRKQ